MSDTTFVVMYHPSLGNVQVDAPLQAVSTYQSHGWLLLDPQATPPPVASPYLSQPAADSRYLRDWAGAEVLTAGAVRVAPDGHIIVRTADGTTRSTYDTTEQALWTVVGGGSASDSSVAALIPGPSATATALRAAYVPKWKPNMAYASGEFVLNPSGQIVSANTAFTSGASYSASNWTIVSGGGGGSSYTDEQAQDAIAAMFAAGTDSGITFVYDDAGNRIGVTVNDATKAPLLTPTATKTATYTATVGDLAMMNVPAGATTLTLPTAPADKAQVGYRAIGATPAAPLVVNRGGTTDTIGTAGATSASLPMADEIAVLQYDAANTRWLAVSAVKTQTSLDARYGAGLLYPEAYGAKGDWNGTTGTDDTVALQACFDAALAAGKTVFLSKFYLTGPLIYRAPILGVGSGQCGLVATANLTSHLLRTPSWDASYGTYLANGGDYAPRISGISLNGRRSVQAAPIASSAVPTPTGTPSTTGGTLAAATYGYRIAPKNAYGVGMVSTRVEVVTTGTTSSVALSWTAVPGATSYIVYGRTDFAETKLAEVGTNSYTDTGAATSVLIGTPQRGNVTAPAGLALYAVDTTLFDVQVVNSAGPGIVSQWFDTTPNGTLPAGATAAMEASLTRVRVENSGTNSILWDGPHDSMWSDCIFAKPSLVGITGEDNVVINNGPVRAVNCHAWGGGRWAWAVYVESSFFNCQCEGGAAGQMLMMSRRIQMVGGSCFAPSGATSVGLKIGDSTFTADRVTVNDVLLFGFSSSSGVALDLSNAGANLQINASIEQDTGTRASFRAGQGYLDIILTQTGAATKVVPPLGVEKSTSAFLAADITTASAALVTVTGFGFGVVSGATYVVEADGYFSSPDATNGVKLGIGGAGTSMYRGTVEYATSATAPPSALVSLATNSSFATTPAGPATTDLFFRARAVFTASVSGTVGLTWGTTNVAATMTMRAGTRSSIRRIA